MGRFEKGNQAAKGREIPEGQLALRRLTKVQLETIIHKYLYLPKKELDRVIKNPDNIPMIELIVVGIMARAASGGDDNRLQSILNIIHGKIPDRVKVEDETDRAQIERLKAQLRESLRPSDE